MRVEMAGIRKESEWVMMGWNKVVENKTILTVKSLTKKKKKGAKNSFLTLPLKPQPSRFFLSVSLSLTQQPGSPTHSNCFIHSQTHHIHKQPPSHFMPSHPTGGMPLLVIHAPAARYYCSICSSHHKKGTTKAFHAGTEDTERGK